MSRTMYKCVFVLLTSIPFFFMFCFTVIIIIIAIITFPSGHTV